MYSSLEKLVFLPLRKCFVSLYVFPHLFSFFSADAEVEREILRRQAAVKSAPAEDLRAFMDQLGIPKQD